MRKDKEQEFDAMLLAAILACPPKAVFTPNMISYALKVERGIDVAEEFFLQSLERLEAAGKLTSFEVSPNNKRWRRA